MRVASQAPRVISQIAETADPPKTLAMIAPRPVRRGR
jgi:hypothetical protein